VWKACSAGVLGAYLPPEPRPPGHGLATPWCRDLLEEWAGAPAFWQALAYAEKAPCTGCCGEVEE
jgi:hypothetical protein